MVDRADPTNVCLLKFLWVPLLCMAQQTFVHQTFASWWLLFDCSVLSVSLWPHELHHHTIPGIPVLGSHLLDFVQTHVHRISDAIQRSHPLSSPPALNLSQHQGLYSESALCIRWPKYWSFSFSISPSNDMQGWFPSGLNCCSRNSQVFSTTTIQKHQFFSAQPSLWSNSHIHDYWKNHSFDYMDFCFST